MISSGIQSILKSAEELKSEPIHITGATLTSSAYLILRLFQETSRSQVILCPTDDIASDLAADLESLSSALSSSSIQILHFPTWEQSPYSSVTLSLRTRLARIQVLSALAQGNFKGIIVTSLPAACQATLPVSVLKTFSISLVAEESVKSREDLVARLIEAGYQRVDPVEDPGTFAVRGDIVDIFPTNRVRPLRVELFGDLIERMREFDPATQRAASEFEKPLQNAVISPAREVLVNSATASTLRERIKHFADEAGISRNLRDPVLASIQQGYYHDHSEAWAPFAYAEKASLWSYLRTPLAGAPSTQIVYYDELSCHQEWTRFLDGQRESSQNRGTTESLIPSVDELFPWSEETEKSIQTQSAFYLDRLELANLETVEKAEAAESDIQTQEKPESKTRHRVSVKPNTDLTRGTRHSLGELEPQIRTWLEGGYTVFVFASTESQIQRIQFLLEQRKVPCSPLKQGTASPLSEPHVRLALGSLSEGFRWPAERTVFLNESEILGSRHNPQRRKKSAESGSSAKNWSGLQALSDLSTGDLIVHVEHGIGRYQGISRLDLSGAPSDFLVLEYANKDKLYLPVYRLNAIQKYVGGGESAQLDRLGSQQFQKTKEKVKSAVRKLAFDLIQLYAERAMRSGTRFSPRDASYSEFEAAFPFDETPDQINAIDSILTDMESGKVMDRLVCGDVGYGKTEVAIRAAFRAVSDGKQVVVLVPTTILSQQHELSFKSRLKGHPVIIESLSRFKTKAEQTQILKALAQGKVDIIIGTHRLLSRDVKFQDLGLVIVDEEHRFGVEHKERLKLLKTNVHVLTLTATPIPRTLHMALSGLRDISLINTPPMNRLPIRTYVAKFDEAVIKRAIEFELSRGGQVFLLHNRVHSIRETAARIRELVPGANVIVAHGQMPEHELEDTMAAFYERKANVLVCTTIIESGLDLPLANTVIILRADTMGLAQLYQIRGRVGRGQQRAYAYLMIPNESEVTDDAKRRLEVIQRFVELGSGFSIASHDLEIRGGGDLLGPQQSGNIAAVGFDLYTELLEEAIREAQGKPATLETRREPEIKVPIAAFLAEDYVPDVHQRLSLYRRFSAAAQDTEIDQLEEELRDRFGPPPPEAQNLLWLVRIKVLLKIYGIDAMTVGPEKVALVPGSNSQLNSARAIALVSARPNQYQITPDSKLVVKLPTGHLRDLFFSLESLMKDFSGKA